METFKYTDVLAANKAFANKFAKMQPYRIKVLTNITLNQLSEILKYKLYQSDIPSVVELGEYDNIVQDSQHCFDYDLVIVHYDLMTIFEKRRDFVEGMSEDKIENLINSIQGELEFIFHNLKDVPILIFNSFVHTTIYQNDINPSKISHIVDELNIFIKSFNQTNLKVVDFNNVISRIGLQQSLNIKLYTVSKTLYTSNLWMSYAHSIAPLIFKVKGKLKKAIIFDCDNTLWHGIIGEDGFSGIDMSISSKKGYHYNKVQQIAQWLSKQGVIIGLCSKNNSADVDEIIEKHPDMCLTNDDIVIKKINWNEKPSNLRQIAKDLNIGIDSLIFVDDSDFEINFVKETIPEVLTFQVPSNIIEYPASLLEIINRNFFLEGSKADIERTQQYKQQAKRISERDNFSSIDSYLKSLKLHLTIEVNDVGSIERIAQLSQKTNQFNLTTYRYTEEQITKIMETDKVISISVDDKFGDSGLTGVVIVKKFGATAIIDSFIMSCRIMGRNIEKTIMDYVIDLLISDGIKVVTSKYSPTKKNLPVKNLYEDFNFKVIKEDNGIKDYELMILDYKKQNIEYIKIN